MSMTRQKKPSLGAQMYTANCLLVSDECFYPSLPGFLLRHNHRINNGGWHHCPCNLLFPWEGDKKDENNETRMNPKIVTFEMEKEKVFVFSFTTKKYFFKVTMVEKTGIFQAWCHLATTYLTWLDNSYYYLLTKYELSDYVPGLLVWFAPKHLDKTAILRHTWKQFTTIQNHFCVWFAIKLLERGGLWNTHQSCSWEY